MATARMSRFCVALPSIENLTLNTAPYLRRTTSSRQQVSSKPYRTRNLLPKTGLHTRRYSASARSASDSTEPLQQQNEASQRRAETLRESTVEFTGTRTQTETSVPATNTSFPHPNATTTTETTTNIPPEPSETSTQTPSPFQSDIEFIETSRRIVGIVTRTGTMSKTVAVSTNRQHFDRFLQKHYTKAAKTLVHDPGEMLVEGDVIEYGLFPPQERAHRIRTGRGKRVKYVVRNVVTPFGVPLDQRVPRGAVSGRLEA